MTCVTSSSPAAPSPCARLASSPRPAAGRYKFRTYWNNPAVDVPSGDPVRFFLDDRSVFDGKGPSAGEIDLEARTYNLRYEYIHTSSKPPSFMLAWTRPDKPGMGQIEVGAYGITYPKPFIHELKASDSDQFHIVAPDPVAVEDLASGGARIGAGEFVLISDETKSVQKDGLTFTGKIAYARPGELALFDGTHIELNGLGLSRSDGDFGASIKQTSPKTLAGRVAGRSGGSLQVHLPQGFSTHNLKATFNGQSVPLTLQGSTASFAVTIAQSDGIKEFTIA